MLPERGEYTEEPKIPRQRTAPKRYSFGKSVKVFDNAQEYFKQQIMEAIQLVIQELSRRFCETLQQPLEIGKIFTFCRKWIGHSYTQSLIDLYTKDISFNKLGIELRMLPQLIELHNNKEIIKIKGLTSVLTLWMTELFEGSDVYSEHLCKIIRLFYTIPLSTATAQISYSELRIIKTFLRTTTTQIRLNNYS